MKTVSYSPNGSFLATGGKDGTVLIWDTKTTALRRKVNVLTNRNVTGLTQIVYSPDGNLLGIGAAGAALLLNVDSLEVVHKISGRGDFYLAFPPNGAHAVDKPFLQFVHCAGERNEALEGARTFDKIHNGGGYPGNY